MKLLSHDSDRRRQDSIDLDELKAVATADDWTLAAAACDLITTRGFHRDRNLPELLSNLRA